MKKNGVSRSHNGWLTALADFAAGAYGWSFDDILWRVPAAAIVLLRREHRRQGGADDTMNLTDIELIDTWQRQN